MQRDASLFKDLKSGKSLSFASPRPDKHYRWRREMLAAFSGWSSWGYSPCFPAGSAMHRKCAGKKLGTR